MYPLLFAALSGLLTIGTCLTSGPFQAIIAGLAVFAALSAICQIVIESRIRIIRAINKQTEIIEKIYIHSK